MTDQTAPEPRTDYPSPASLPPGPDTPLVNRPVDLRRYPVVRYYRHNCERRHRTPRTFAQCVWKHAVWIIGVGAYATVSTCSHGARRRCTTVMLHPTVEDAQQALATIDATGCGGRCTRQHKLIELVLDGGDT